jgi:hypothetical protein
VLALIAGASVYQFFFGKIFQIPGLNIRSLLI